MVKIRLLVGFLATLLVATGAAQENNHEHGTGEKLGTVNFATSCSDPAQKDFNRAVTLLHSFQFSRAIQGFKTALKSDATCGIAFWGIALSQWSNPFALGMKDTGQLQAGWESVERGHAVGQDRARTSLYRRRCQVI